MENKTEDIAELSQCAVESLVDSYEARFVAVFSFLDQAMEAIRAHRNDFDELVTLLRDLYAAEASLRKRDFNAVVQKPLRYLQESEDRIARALDSFRHEEGQLIAVLRSSLAGKQPLEPARWHHPRHQLAGRQQAREAELGRLLRDYHVELNKLIGFFSALLKKKRQLQVGELKNLVNTVVQQRTYEETDLARSLRELDEVQERIRRQWGEVLAATTMEGR